MTSAEGTMLKNNMTFLPAVLHLTYLAHCFEKANDRNRKCLTYIKDDKQIFYHSKKNKSLSKALYK